MSVSGPTPHRSRRRRSRLLALVVATAVSLATATAASGTTPRRTAALAGTPTTIVMVWGPDRATRGQKVTASGTIAPHTEARTVRLQRQVPGGGWATLASRTLAADPASASFSFALPTSYYGSFMLRVSSPAGATEAGAASDPHSLRVTPPYDPRGSASSHRFFSPLSRWDPCTRIDYRVNTRKARSGALKDVKGAITRLRFATGLPFHYAGPTTKVPTGRSGDRYPKGTELVIAWARPSSTNMLGAGSTAAGKGGYVSSSGYVDSAGHPVYRITQGGVVLNANLNSRIKGGFGTGQTRGELLMHELGHAVGLDHTSARGQIMYPTLQPGVARYEAGDLAGLNQLGRQRWCLAPAGSGRSLRGEGTLPNSSRHSLPLQLSSS